MVVQLFAGTKFSARVRAPIESSDTVLFAVGFSFSRLQEYSIVGVLLGLLTIEVGWKRR